MATNPHWRPETLALHAGYEEADVATKARAVPIYQVPPVSHKCSDHALIRSNPFSSSLQPFSPFARPVLPPLRRRQTTSFVFNDSQHAANLFGVSPASARSSDCPVADLPPFPQLKGALELVNSASRGFSIPE
jgi:hypothetical protein